jgi:PAS domain S-box-containing protein
VPFERALTRWVTLAAAALSIALFAGPPAATFFFSRERIAGGLEAETEITSHLVTQIVSANPDLWEFEQARLGEYLARRPRAGDPEVRRVLDANGRVVAEVGDPLPRPWIRRSLPLLDAGVPVGTVDVARSLRPILLQSVLLALLLAVPALLAFRILRTLPLAALHRAEQDLRRERDAAQTYLDVAGVAFVILDAGGTVVRVNRKAAELLGRPQSEILGREWQATFVEPSERGRLQAATAGSALGAVVQLEFAVLRPSGERRTVDWYATPLPEGDGDRSGLLLSGVDISHQRQLEERLRHAEKLRAVGQLAEGLAHDFNNILSVVRTRAALLRSDLALGSPHRLDAEEILAAADRAGHLTRALLTFSRRQLAAEPTDLVDLVRRSERRLHRLVPEGTTLTIELPPAPIRLLADPIQLELVLESLITWARESIAGAGPIVVGVSEVRLSAEAAAQSGIDGQDPWAAITVAGPGVAPGKQSGAFDPGAAVDVGKGTHPGMAIALGIVEMHRGAIRIAGPPGKVAAVTVLLPVMSAAARA